MQLAQPSSGAAFGVGWIMKTRFLSRPWILSIGAVVLCVVLGVLYHWRSEWKKAYFVGYSQCVILLLTAGVVAWYTLETKKLREESAKQTKLIKEANQFSAFGVYSRLIDKRKCELRDYVERVFSDNLVMYVTQMSHEARFHYLRGCISSGPPKQGVEVGQVIEKLHEDLRAQARLNHIMKDYIVISDGLDKVSALEAVDGVLHDFGAVALSFQMGMAGMKEVELAFEHEFIRTAKSLLPYVAIQTVVRGKSDPRYERSYLEMLRTLPALEAEDRRDVELICRFQDRLCQVEDMNKG